MKLFFGFILGSYFFGVYAARFPRKKKLFYIFGLGLVVCCGYYFLNMI
jgi:MFS family permease